MRQSFQHIPLATALAVVLLVGVPHFLMPHAVACTLTTGQMHPAQTSKQLEGITY